jgi:hypothetical protein
MNVREDFVEKISSNLISVYYKFPRKNIFSFRKKYKFLIQPLLEGDFITEEIMKLTKEEMSKGNTVEQASRIAADEIKKNFTYEKMGKLLIQKSVGYPKIVDHNIGNKDDELPFSFLTPDMKKFLILEIAKISPVFQGK